jgi:hexosaminidase
MRNGCIIPKPLELVRLDGAFSLKPGTPIQVAGEARAVAAYLQDLIRRATGGLPELTETGAGQARPGTILLTTATAEPGLGDEGYALSVTSDSVTMRAPQAAGLFYAVQTLRQLLPPEIENRTGGSPRAWDIPALAITDRPRFPWRGLMLDVARHCFPVEFVKRFIDLLAMHKLNVLHWHLTDDQGWRVEIEKYPRLVEIGSRRQATPFPADRRRLDGIPYAGFYTQAQIQEVVQYAADRFVTLVPEIEMPGHALAALASYPELGCTGGPYAVGTYWGIQEDVFCAGNERVYAFLEDVLDEVIRLFPGQFVHIGGDECPKRRWQGCPKCQAMIKQTGLKDESELQSYFVKRMESALAGMGRRLIGWDEILEGGLAPHASVMSWRGIQGGIAAAAAGHDVVMSPTSHCYFDYYQSEDQAKEPPAIFGFIPLEKVYAYQPVPSELPPDQAAHILGAQGNVWTEYMPHGRQVEYMTYPRACALSEVVWSSPPSPDYQEFLGRLRVHLTRLDALGVHFRDPFSDERESELQP